MNGYTRPFLEFFDIKPIITVHINTTGKGKEILPSRTPNIIQSVQGYVEGIHRTELITVNILWKNYNSMVENTTFTTVRDFVAGLEVFANKYLPGIHFHIESNDVGYTMSATDEGQVHSEKSITLLQEWLSTGIATAIKTKLKVIAMQYDNKTGVYNDSMIHRVWNNSTSSVIFFDINQFKRINDTVSYAKGDEMLQSFAQILKEGKKMLSHAEVIRNGGDEFLVIVENTDLHSIMLYISRVQKLFSQIPGSHGASYGYFFRRGDNTYTTFSKAYSYADQHMKSRKGREGKIYRIQQSIESLSDEEKIELTKNLLGNLDSESLNLILDSHKK